MSLISATKFPWPELASWFPKSHRQIWEAMPDFRPEPALLFAADSRWTYNKDCYLDGAVKVRPIDSFGAAAYAGNALAGEVALSRLAKWMQDARSGNSEVDLVDLLDEVWDRYSHLGGGLQLLMGFFDRFGESHLFRFTDVDGFSPHIVTDPESIGLKPATDLFSQQVRDVIIQHFTAPRTQRVISQDCLDWLSLLTASIWRVSESQVGRDCGVGGPPLALAVARIGLNSPSLSIFDPTSGRVVGHSLTRDEAENFYSHPKNKNVERPNLDWLSRA